VIHVNTQDQSSVGEGFGVMFGDERGGAKPASSESGEVKQGVPK